MLISVLGTIYDLQIFSLKSTLLAKTPLRTAAGNWAYSVLSGIFKASNKAWAMPRLIYFRTFIEIFLQAPLNFLWGRASQVVHTLPHAHRPDTHYHLHSKTHTTPQQVRHTLLHYIHVWHTLPQTHRLDTHYPTSVSVLKIMTKPWTSNQQSHSIGFALATNKHNYADKWLRWVLVF